MNKQERFEYWTKFVIHHPKANIFDAKQFFIDMIEKNFLTILNYQQKRLVTMMNIYIKENRNFLSKQLKLNSNECQQICKKALEKFIQCDFTHMTLLDIDLINNAYQSSDPIEYPIDDLQLRIIFDMIAVLHEVLRSASQSLTYSFE
ncbi:unnamed protein product [Rotaria sordida]|uniref:Uncharacterized protein n=1 Tax=Rotaria sordida TaxID=392033 RepID=A0A818LEC4_9BILA|nr:unnamed protein product [Rotaria sordida]CAF1332568.1 unnamed protein product [Rotaria sordida]CAF1352693.1 unnamed protein product [Rotaria sordida]CAF3564878.1 unnamed protein product [Rotaria sordida]